MPVNGAAYWWTAALAPPKYSRFLSFVSGWIIVLSLFCNVASYAYAMSSQICTGISLIVPSWYATNAESMAVSMAVVLVWAILMLLKLEDVKWVYYSCCKFPSTSNSFHVF